MFFLAGLIYGVGIGLLIQRFRRWRLEHERPELGAQEEEKVDEVTIVWPPPAELARMAAMHPTVSPRLLPRLHVDLYPLMREVEEHLLNHTRCGRITGFELHFSLVRPPILRVMTSIGGRPFTIASKPVPGQELNLVNVFVSLHKQIDAATHLHKPKADGGVH